MKPAIVVIDMLNDNITRNPESKISREARKIIPRIKTLVERGRSRGIPVVFACDSYRINDFIFEGRGKPVCIEGTRGAEVIDELRPQNGDIVIKKRRFSAFFRTDLDLTLRRTGCDTILLCGITTQFCVLATAIDGICCDFRVVLVKDCCASHDTDIHSKLMAMYQTTLLYPLLRVMAIDDLKEEFWRNQDDTETKEGFDADSVLK
jgi:nicotinamidase-related amidase